MNLVSATTDANLEKDFVVKAITESNNDENTKYAFTTKKEAKNHL